MAHRAHRMVEGGIMSGGGSAIRGFLVQTLVASEEATSGSVMQNAERISPRMSGASHSACCSGFL